MFCGLIAVQERGNIFLVSHVIHSQEAENVSFTIAYIFLLFNHHDARHASAPNLPPSRLAPVFFEGVDRILSRTWRPVDTSSVEWLKHCHVEVDEGECGAPGSAPDPFAQFLEMASAMMSQTGGAIPSIVDNAIDQDGWEKVLEDSVQKNFHDVDKRLAHVLHGKRIRIFGSGGSGRPPFVSMSSEGNVKWSLEDSQFSSARQIPDMNKPDLYIFINQFHMVKTYMTDKNNSAAHLLGRLRVLIHELIHGIRILKSIIRSFGSLVWFRNQYHDWCVDKSVYDKDIATPPRLGPNAQDLSASSGYPADAGRTWEHSITCGKAFFQRDLEVVVFVRGKFETAELSLTDARTILANPKALIEISRRRADEIAVTAGGAAVLYTSYSGTVSTFEYQCSGSSRWFVDNLGEYYSSRAAFAVSASVDATDHPASAAQVCHNHATLHLACRVTVLLRRS